LQECATTNVSLRLTPAHGVPSPGDSNPSVLSRGQ